MRFWRGLLAGLLLAAGVSGGGPGRAVEAQSLGVVGETARPGLNVRSADYELAADVASATDAAAPDEARIAAALVEMLRIGIGTVVATLGRSGGFATTRLSASPCPAASPACETASSVPGSVPCWSISKAV